MAVDGDYDKINEGESHNKEKMGRGAAAWEVLTRIELDMSYSSEKALNLEMLLIQVEDVASDYAALSVETEDISNEAIVKAFEFDILSGILNSAVKELDNIVDSGQKLLESVHSEDLPVEIKEQMQDAEKSLKNTQDVVADIRMRSAKFESDLAFAGFGTRIGADAEMEINPCSPTTTDAKWKEQKEQQRHFLQMLEKSLARELDLEKKLSESRHNEDELKLKLHYAEQLTYNFEESMEMILQRMFEAENAADTLLGISKELAGKLQIVQFNLKGSLLQESQVRFKLEESTKKLSSEARAVEKMKTNYAESNDLLLIQESVLNANLQKAKDECSPTISETLRLRDEVRDLEEQLRESDAQLQIAKVSAEASREQQNILRVELSDKENGIEGLKEDVSRLESRAESAEENCVQLTKTNFELNEQLDCLRSDGAEKAIFLEKQLKESDTQLEHAKASVEAIEEQRSMLYSAISDMENLIVDLKGKVSKAESRAESAESKCTLLTETNLELNEELGFLRSRLECVEASLNQVEDARIATAKDIGIRTKLITDLVMKLAMERERLQLQISALTKQNKFLAKKNLKTMDSTPDDSIQKETDNGNKSSILESPEEALKGSATTRIQVDKSVAARTCSETSIETTALTEDSSLGAGLKLETVRTIEATQLNFKFLFMAVLFLLVSIFAIYLFQLEN